MVHPFIQILAAQTMGIFRPFPNRLWYCTGADLWTRLDRPVRPDGRSHVRRHHRRRRWVRLHLRKDLHTFDGLSKQKRKIDCPLVLRLGGPVSLCPFATLPIIRAAEVDSDGIRLLCRSPSHNLRLRRFAFVSNLVSAWHSGFYRSAGVQKQALPLAVFAAQLYFNFKWPQLFFIEKKIVSGAAK